MKSIGRGIVSEFAFSKKRESRIRGEETGSSKKIKITAFIEHLPYARYYAELCILSFNPPTNLMRSELFLSTILHISKLSLRVVNYLAQGFI